LSVYKQSARCRRRNNVRPRGNAQVRFIIWAALIYLFVGTLSLPAQPPTQLLVSPNPAVYGQRVTFTAMVNADTGTVQFCDATPSIPTCPTEKMPVMNGEATYSPMPPLSVGTYTVIAVYAGQDSNSVSLTINQANTSTVLSAVQSGPTVTLTATVSVVSPGAGNPTGSVTFHFGNTTLGTVPLSGNTATLPPLANFAGAVYAVYSGDTNFNSSTSNSVNFLAATSVAVSSSPNPSVFGQAVTLAANISTNAPSLPAPGGTVQFLAGTTPIGSPVAVSNHSASLSTATLSTGAHTITAQYSGDSYYQPATNTTSQSVNKASTSTGFTFAQSGAVVTFAATVTPVAPGAGMPTGQVQFFNGTTPLGSAPLTNARATFSASNLSGTVTAVYSGDGNFLASTSGGAPINASAAVTVIAAANPSPLVFGQAVALSATITVVTGNGVLPGGTVQFLNGSTLLGSAPVYGGFASLILLPGLGVGTQTITAQYRGDGFYPAASATTTVSVSKANTVTSLSVSQSGSSVSLMVAVAPVSPGSGTPSGSIQFLKGNTVLGTSALVNSQATFSASNLTGVVTAIYSGDSNFNGSTSSGTSITTQSQPSPPSTPQQPSVSLSISSGLNPSLLGQAVTFTTTITVVSGTGTPSGSIQFLDGTTSLGSVPLTGNSVSFTTSALTVGSHAISAQYSGDSVFPPASAAMGQVVNRLTTTLSLAVSPTQVTSGQSVTLTAQLGPQPPAGVAAPTGTVTFSDGGTSLGTATVTGSVATITTGALNAGPQQFSAVYSGDKNYTNSSTSASLTVTLSSLTITTTSLGNATVTQPYSATLAATGGVVPYTWTIGNLPPGLAGASNGVISGTPTDTGSYSVSVQVTDSKSSTASISLSMVVVALPLTISATLPNGKQGMTYSGSISGLGGVPPYKVNVSGLPSGLSFSAGAVAGQPTFAGSSTVTVQITDSKNTSATQQFSIVIAAVPLTITTTSLSNGTAGQPYGQTVSAIGGAPPYSWSGSLPSGLSIASIGPTDASLSGTPTVGGQVTVTVLVTDSAGATATATYTVTLALPVTPQVSFTGIGDTVSAQTQPGFGIALNAPYPVDIQGTVTLSFQPTAGSDTGEVVYVTGGRKLQFDIPAYTKTAAFFVPCSTTVTCPVSAAFQSGTVAGAITLTVDLQTTNGIDITPTPAPAITVQVPPGPPVITQLQASMSTGALTVSITGYSTTLEVTQAVFQFNPAAGANLQTTSLTLPIGSLFAPWFQSSQIIGSQFLFTQQFAIQGSTQAVSSVTVTISNTQGASQPVTATVTSP
jgi:Bacterial Ig-like domain (group 3)/Putative Ig domain